MKLTMGLELVAYDDLQSFLCDIDDLNMGLVVLKSNDNGYEYIVKRFKKKLMQIKKCMKYDSVIEVNFYHIVYGWHLGNKNDDE
jgi:hypothetical protein